MGNSLFRSALSFSLVVVSVLLLVALSFLRIPPETFYVPHCLAPLSSQPAQKTNGVDQTAGINFFVNGPPPSTHQFSDVTFFYRVEQSGCTVSFSTPSHIYAVPLPLTTSGIREACAYVGTLVVNLGAHLNLSREPQKIKYRVLQKDASLLFDGTLPYFPPTHTGHLNVGVTSCNDPVSTRDIPGNTYWDGTEHTLAWAALQRENNDVVLHLGDNVYLDSVWDAFSREKRPIDTVGVRELARTYYGLAFSDRNQGSCMRSGFQIVLRDDHDWVDGWGTAVGGTSKGDPRVASYAQVVGSVHDEYFHVLHKPHHTLGNYQFVTPDVRHVRAELGPRADDTLLKSISAALKIPRNFTKRILCLPTPLVHLGPIQAWVVGIVFSDGLDQYQHPSHLAHANAILDLLAQHPNALVVAGDLHHGFLQKHRAGQTLEMMTSGITRRTVGQGSFSSKLANYFQRTFALNLSISNRQQYTEAANYGVIQNGRPSIVRVS
jgi:hypothetical protein